MNDHPRRPPWSVFALVIFLTAMVIGIAHAEDEDAEDDTYHPPKDSTGREYDSYGDRWLAAMAEPSLVPTKGNSEEFALRFFWLRSFHDPISIRIWRTGSSYKMRAVRMKKPIEYGPGPIAEDTTRDLKPEEWTQVIRLTAGNVFWIPLTQGEQQAFPLLVKDGSTWCFERLSVGKRVSLELRNVPHLNSMIRENGKSAPNIRDFDAYKRLGTYLLKITGLTPKEQREFY